MNLSFLRFTDGVTRVVYPDLRGQYVHDDKGAGVYSVWLHPDEYQEPIVLEVPTK